MEFTAKVRDKRAAHLWGSVLASVGIQLIVSLVAGTVLCFEFSMPRMLITLMFSVVAK